MTPDEHREAHVKLHTALDTLVADFITHNAGKGLGNTTVMELIQWSHNQTVLPSVVGETQLPLIH